MSVPGPIYSRHGLTLEYLEHKACPSWITKRMTPAFYTISSGFGVDYRVDDGGSGFSRPSWNLVVAKGMVVGNPIPEEFAMDRDYIDAKINEALAEADRLGIKGKDTTPFLLDAIQKATAGKSLEANIQLVLNNAALAAQIAVEYSKLGPI